MSRFESKVNNKSKYRPKAVKLMDQVYEVLRYHHYGKRTEEAYSLTTEKPIGYAVIIHRYCADV